MAIRKFKDYEQTKAYGNFQALPKGGYVLQIKGATVHENTVGQYIKVSCDVAEGEYTGYFTKDYQDQSGEDKKWHCHYLLNVPKDDGSEKDGWTKRHFKTFTEALEESNPGYHFDWDETKFRGLYIGGLFNIREYEKNDGSVGEATNLAKVTNVEAIRSGNYRLPNDKKLKGGRGSYADADGFMRIEDGAGEALPFD